MSGRIRLAAVAAALVAVFVAAPPASAYITVETTGRTGLWSIADSDTAAALACAYPAEDLTRLTVSPPLMYSQARRARRVGWQFEVWRAKWWMKTPDQWHLAYASPIAKARATQKVSPLFAPREWTVPVEWRTAYDSFKVRIVMRWYAADRRRVVGQTTIELGYSEAGAGVVAAPCTGSFDAPRPPDPGTVAAAPSGLAPMSHWRPYWKGISDTGVNAMISELTRMHQTGVVLTGIESGNKYALPPDVARYLGMLRDAGIKPYLALWISRFSDAELATTLRAWNAGAGQWAGVVLDVERGLELYTIADRAGAVAAMNRYMVQVRPLTNFIGVSSFGIFSDYADMPWSELNAHADVLMPQLYFRQDEEALWLLDKMQASIDYESGAWSQPAKPVVPVVNDWGDGVDLEQLERYIEIAFARYGAVSGWRLHSNMHEEVKDLWATFPR